jgi:nucleotide-binding universal stress UspA family protein
MCVLRFRDRSKREFLVPLNIKIGTIEIPIGLPLIFMVLMAAAVTNLFTKDVATKWGLGFTGALLFMFIVTERYYEYRRKGTKHEFREQFNRQTESQLSLTGLGLDRFKYRKLIAIRSPNNLFMLEKALDESDPSTTAVIVMTAKLDQSGALERPEQELDTYDQDLMTAVVNRAEKSGKEVVPLIVPTNNPLYALVRTAKELDVQELIVGVSNKNTADEQLDQLAFYWFNLCEGAPTPLTVRILSRDREVHLDLAGGNRIPKISERQAKSVAELRAAGVGVRRMLMAHDGSPSSHDLFQNILTMLDSKVVLQVVAVPSEKVTEIDAQRHIDLDRQWAKRLGRDVDISVLAGDPGPELVRLAREEHYDLIALAFPDPWSEATRDRRPIPWLGHILEHAACPIFVAVPPGIPTEVEA